MVLRTGMGRVGELFKRLEERTSLYQGESSSWEALGLRTWISEHAKRWPELSVGELEEVFEIKSIWVSDLDREPNLNPNSRLEGSEEPFLHQTERSSFQARRLARLRGISPEGELNLDSFGRPLQPIVDLEPRRLGRLA